MKFDKKTKLRVGEIFFKKIILYKTNNNQDDENIIQNIEN
jgi:hypothetical protein